MPESIPFRLEFPVDVWKSDDAGKEMRIGGIISTEDVDRQGEVVIQDGLDFSDFLSNGWINDNHSKDTAGILGYPIRVEKTSVGGRPATRMEAYLIPDYEPAKKIWELGKGLSKTGRKLGFSIEGKVEKRTGVGGKTIARARVTNVAVTNCPVNTATGLEVIAKSMKAIEEIDKALTAGSDVASPGAVQGSGFALRTESLEADPKVTTYHVPKKKKKKKKKLTKSDIEAEVRSRFAGAQSDAIEKVIDFARGATK